MLMRITLLAAIAGFCASAGSASDCATNFRHSGLGTETSVDVASHTPEDVIIRLGGRLQAAGVTMRTSEPKAGLLNATGLSVSAKQSGTSTRVTFVSSVSADQSTLCRYASMLVDPPLTNNDVVLFHERGLSDEEAIHRIRAAIEVRFDLSDNGLITLKRRKVGPLVIDAMTRRASAAIISSANAADRTSAQIRADLVARREIGVNNYSVAFSSGDILMDFAVVSSRPIASDTREYLVSMLVPREACMIATEDIHEVTMGFAGEKPPDRDKPVRVEALVDYTHRHGVAELTSVEIRKMEIMP